LLATTQGLAPGQQSAAPKTPYPPTIGIDKATMAGQTVSKNHGSADQRARNSCSLKVRESFPSANTKQAMVSKGGDYTPLSARCKFHLFVKQTYSPYTFASAGFQATWAQATGQWPQYGGGAAGFGKRFGATLADTESRRFIQTFALSTLLHQDPRYFPSLKRKFISRSWHAVTRVVVTKSDNGGSTFNSSEFLGALFTSALQNSYYPRHYRTFADTMSRFGGALSSDAISYVLREFTPDMKRLFRRHAPKEIQRIEEKLPIPPDDRP
jgi:hypothetical protein